MSRLVVVSNRVPDAEGKPAAGGLAVAMEAALRAAGGLWFGWSGRTAEGAVGPTEVSERGGVAYATIDINASDYRGYYEGYANQTLWPLFHYRIDLARFDRSLFERYHAVNQVFAERLLPHLDDGDLVWVQDYHLIPLGEELRRRGCRQRIGFFLHTPFPAPELMVILFNHRRLVRSLLAYDLIGFQTAGDLRSFRDYVVQELRDGRVLADGRVAAYDEAVRAEVFAIGIDPEAFRDLAASPEAERYRERVARSLPEGSLIVSVDRLDYSKGLPERILAVEDLLERRPEHRGSVTFMQIASPSRTDVPQYQDIRLEIEAAVGQVNGRFAESDWTPMRYVSRTYSQRLLCGLYAMARVGLVTPLRDGMNLVAKEYVAAQDEADPGVLVLSRFAGAADQLDAALIVNPYDTLEVSEAIHQALTMPLDERSERWRAMMAVLERDSLTAWRERFVARLAATPAG